MFLHLSKIPKKIQGNHPPDFALKLRYFKLTLYQAGGQGGEGLAYFDPK